MNTCSRGQEQVLTSVGLDARSNFAGSNVVEVRDILTEDSPEIALTDALGVHLTGVDPNNHVSVSANEHADT